MLDQFIKVLGSVLKRLKGALLLILVIGALAFFLGAGTYVDRKMNVRLLDELPQTVSSQARDLHRDLVIADWHADNLLWARDPLDRLDRGHVDIPRLIEGNFSLQVFDAVIKTPRGQNYESNDDNTDNIMYIAMANRWPVGSWFNLTKRALHQSDILHRAAEQSSSLTLIKTRGELDIFLKLRRNNTTKVGGLLAVEGLHALEGKLENVDVLYDAGFRVMGLVHFFDNEIGGSSAGVEKGGLTTFGKEVIQRMNSMGIIIDLAHASAATFDEVIQFSTKPVIVSHTGVKGTYDSPRNLSDQQLRALAEKGGIVGIGFWDGAVGSTSIESITQAIRHAVSVAGIDHVSLGSDFDGGTTILFDASQIILLTDGLLRAGFNKEEVAKIMGGNQVRFLLEQLPD
ncbi:MAG: dipeptidase [Bacteroidota bacterium]